MLFALLIKHLQHQIGIQVKVVSIFLYQKELLLMGLYYAYNVRYGLVARLGLEPRKPTSEDGVLTD